MSCVGDYFVNMIATITLLVLAGEQTPIVILNNELLIFFEILKFSFNSFINDATITQLVFWI